jgi:cobalt/nickel transport system permease protein
VVSLLVVGRAVACLIVLNLLLFHPLEKEPKLSILFKEANQMETSVIHRVDPRVKLIVALVFIVSVNLIPPGRWWLYFLFGLVILFFFILSRLSLIQAFKKTLMATPFILAALSIPFTTPGEVVWTVPWVDWTITAKGLELMLSVLLRFWLAVQMAVLLSSVTRIPDLLWALRALRVPAVLIGVVAVMYRYLRVLGSEATRMLRARAARSCKVEGHRTPNLIWRAKVTGTMIGSLFLRAFDRSDRIHHAMLSRGYNGSFRSLISFRMDVCDWLVLFGCLFLALTFFSWVF